MNADDVIARCTRDGKVLWPHVAAQLGRCVDSVRAQYDPTYMRSHIWAPSREPQPEMDDIDTSDLHSPYVKAPPLKTGVLARLRMGPASTATIAAFLARPSGSVSNVLTGLTQSGEVIRTGKSVSATYAIAVRQHDASVAGEAA